MTKEQIPVRGVADLLGQLYSLAREYPNFTGVAACRDPDVDIHATVGTGSDLTTFVFVNDDPRIMKEMVDDMARHGCLSGEAIDGRAVIRRVDRRNSSTRRSRSWMHFAAQCAAFTTLAAATSLVVCSFYLGDVDQRMERMRSEIRRLHENARPPAPVEVPPPASVDSDPARNLEEHP